MITQTIRRLALLGASLLILTACGVDDGVAAPTLPSVEAGETVDLTTTTTEPVDPEEAMRLYSECMRDQGIDMPDPTSGGGVIEISGDGGDFEAMDAAAAVCEPILEDAFGEFEMSPEQQAEMLDQELAFAQCMRDNGVDWPDPSGDLSGGVAIQLPDDIDPDSLNAAMSACSSDVFGGDGGFIVGTDAP